MTEVDIPTNQDLMHPTLDAIQQLGGSATKSELEEKVPQVADLSDEQLSVLFPDDSKNAGTPKVLYRMGWALTNLKKINAAENSSRGVWAITPDGTNYLNMPHEEGNNSIRKAVREVYAEEQRGKNDQTGEENDSESSEGETDWQSILLAKLKKMDPSDFERLSMRLLREAGFSKVEVTGKSGDGGIDGVGIYEISPLVSIRICFQCKRYDRSVGPDAVRQFRGAMGGAGKNVEKGILITTGNFTKSARRDAEEGGPPYVDLIDGNKLCQLLYDFRLGIEIQESPTIIRDFFDNI